MKYISAIATIFMVLMATVPGPARTKLSTLPLREKLALRLGLNEVALMIEERDLPLQKGTNHIDFAWNGVSVDPGSIVLEILGNPEGSQNPTKIISTSSPIGSLSLTWRVYAPVPRVERVRVSYIIRGITSEPSYELTVNGTETQGRLRLDMLMRNLSGETLEKASIRLGSMQEAVRTVANGEARRFIAMTAPETSLTKVFSSRPNPGIFQGEDGESMVLSYEIENSAKNGLGSGLMPGGKVRVFSASREISGVFLGENRIKDVPLGDRAEVVVGEVRDVVLKRRLMKEERTNIRRMNRQPVLFDMERTIRLELENYKTEPVVVRVHETVNGEWSVEESPSEDITLEKRSIRELVAIITVPAASEDGKPGKSLHDLRFTIRNIFPNE